jgi:tetratricopeptide (TPR) repeat protein
MRSVRFTRIEAILTLVILIGLTGVVGLSRYIDARRPVAESSVEEEQLYLTAATANRMSLSFKGLVADWYWMRALQYVGRKIVNFDQRVEIDNLGQLNLKLLPPLLDAATTLDPNFIEPYQYAAMVLPTVDVKEAIRILKRGIEANPTRWRLYHNLGYIYWQQKDFKAAADAYSQGAQLPGAPRWMQAMKARMEDAGGSRETAREIYRRMYEDATDDQVKDMARKRLMQLDSFDDRDVLLRILGTYKASTGRCPGSWREILNLMRSARVRVDASGAPVDPAGTPYILLTDKCDVEVDWRSEVPFK